MVISSPCLIDNKELTSPEQTAPGKDFSNPLIVDSLLKTIWSSMHHVFTMKHWLVQSKRLLIIATIDGHSMTITEVSLRRHLKLDDHDGITSLPNSKIFEQLALMGYHTDSDKLTFQKGAFSPQWRFLIHYILHCLSPKKDSLGLQRVIQARVALFPYMLDVTEPSTSPSRITSSPSPSPESSPSPSPEPSPSHSPKPSTQHSPDHTTADVSFPSLTQPT
ncbi:hypothetical protein Tco_0215171 [Tanacetum coccineum]